MIEEKKKKIKNIAEICVILALCLVTVIFDVKQIAGNIIISKQPLRNTHILKMIQQSCGVIAAILLMRRLNIRLFGKPRCLLYLIPCLIIAIDNFQFSSYFNGRMELIHKEPLDVILFGLYCLSVGLFEECIFRGVIFSVLAGHFSKDKKGLWKTYVISSLVFGISHLFNGLSFGTVLQVGYTILTGGLFAFALIKTQNIICAGLVHAVYNFAGLLFDASQRFGLGNGVVFDLGTVITMLIVSIFVGSFVLYSVYKYTPEEQAELYKKLGISLKNKENEVREGES